jgi:gliding motility-associated-like protein
MKKSEKKSLSIDHNHFYLFFRIICFLLPLNVFSQLTVTNNSVATTLAQNIVGSGLTISNANLNCGTNASGTFVCTSTHLGIANGILLTTGKAQGVSNSGSFLCNVVNNNNFTDPQITAISPQATYDVCILQFDFIPKCDTMRISYVFGSDEYPQYINQYNDVFAMFLTGPNPSGGNYTAQNIAKLPNGITPVAIDSINGGWPIGTGASHPNYYVNNYTTPNNDIAYNGYTVPITSTAAITPCVTYHMKIAVADAANAHNDSGVFIEGNTFTCQNAPIVAASSTPTCSNTGSATATVTNYAGTPTYSWSPGSQTTATISNLTTGTYSCVVSLPGVCTTYTVNAVVANATQPNVNAGADMSLTCTTNSVVLNGSSTTTGATYSWSGAGIVSGATSANPTINAQGTYTLTVNTPTGCTATDTVSVHVNNIPPTVDAGISQTLPCGNNAISLNGSSSPSSGCSYNWTTVNGHIVSGATTVSPLIDLSGLYNLSVTNNANGCIATDTVSVFTTTSPHASFTANPLTGTPPLTVNFSNTSQNTNTYLWTFGNGNASSIANPSQIYPNTGNYSVVLVASNNNQCWDTTKITVIVEDNFSLIIPNVFTPNGDGVNDLFIVTATGIKAFDCAIYDRWGLKMKEITDVTTGWEGKSLSGSSASDGIYYYIIKATSNKAEEKNYQGYLLLAK